MQNAILSGAFWDSMPFNMVENDRCFEGIIASIIKEVNFYQITQREMPEDSNLQHIRCVRLVTIITVHDVAAERICKMLAEKYKCPRGRFGHREDR